MSTIIQKTFPVTGMHCASCVGSVEKALQKLPGVNEVSANLANHRIWVAYDPGHTSPAALQQAVEKAGYHLILGETESREERQQKSLRQWKIRSLGALVLAVPVMLISMLLPHTPYTPWLLLGLSLPIVVFFGGHYYYSAWRQIRHGRVNMDSLVALGTGVAFVVSIFNTLYPGFWQSRGHTPHLYYEAAVMIIAFINLGKWLEERGKSRTSEALQKLLQMRPARVNVLEGEHEKQYALQEVQPGMIAMVRPGERIPLDGRVTMGRSSTDESSLTGESMPIAKTEGDKVFAGTINQKGAFRMEVLRGAGHTRLDQIIARVEEAQGSKAPVQRLADRIAGWFVPVVILIALFTFGGWMLWGGEDAFSTALLTAISVLVIACPCALGLATPTAIMAGVGRAAGEHILYRNATTLEHSGKITHMVLDKTGTLTRGIPEVKGAWWQPGTETEKSLLYRIEKQSSHPLAEAVCAHIGTSDMAAAPLDQQEDLTGRGVIARSGKTHYRVGNRSLMDEARVSIPAAANQQALAWEQQGHSLVFFARDHKLLAILALADTIRPEAPQVIAKLQKMGIRISLLTGDHEAPARQVAQQCGIADFAASQRPEDKAAYIRELQQEGALVAMTGDGINDAEALAQADVSFAMGSGADISMEVADITLSRASLESLPRALRLSRKTMKVIRQNLFWAFIYNVSGIPIAAGVLYPALGILLHPMLAAAAMALSSVSVVLNSLRLRYMKIE